MRLRLSATLTAIAAGLIAGSLACDSCFGPINRVEHVRHAKRMQPDAFNATYGPNRGSLEWGQVNFLHTASTSHVLRIGDGMGWDFEDVGADQQLSVQTDTHGWLEGHLKETNYGADWGDFVSFTARMRAKAKEFGVDLLLIDTGDLHDGAGLSGATEVEGEVSNVVFQKLDYDVLAIGNHELYYADIAYQAYNNFSKAWGDRYLTSNVQILDTTTNEYQYLGHQYRYFTTENGLRILAFGVLFDFTGNANVTKVIPAADMVNESWFQAILASPPGPVDLFLVIGHNTVLKERAIGTFGFVHDAIRAVHPSTPVQIFGGHSHIRDFQIYDEATTALESGRYCETLGWLSMSGFSADNSGWTGAAADAPLTLAGDVAVPRPSRPATTENATSTAPWRYSRRYMDWNRLTFEYHASGSQTNYSVDPGAFDVAAGTETTAQIYDLRQQLNITARLGCAPQYWCVSCAEFNSSGSIYSLLAEALSAVVVNETRADKTRVTILNTGSVRFDLHKGPFLYDDTFIISPFDNVFVYIPDVPYSIARNTLDYINEFGTSWKRSTDDEDVSFSKREDVLPRDACVDPFVSPLATRDIESYAREHAGHFRRQTTAELTEGYITTDAFGTDGDDTAHTAIPQFTYPHFFQALGSFPEDGSDPEAVDLIFIDFIAASILQHLASAGTNYTEADVQVYMNDKFTTKTYLPLFVQSSELFQQNLDNCTIF